MSQTGPSGGPQRRVVPRPGEAPGPVFLERATYRQRRLIDAIRLLPLLGVLLWAVPVLWIRGETPSSSALLYLFGVWICLVVASGLLSRALGGAEPSADASGDEGDS